MDDYFASVTDNVFTPDECQAYFASPAACNARQLINKMEHQLLSETESLRVRDFLIVSFAAQNACRSGEIRNMTLQELTEARKYKDDRFVIEVNCTFSHYRIGKRMGHPKHII